MSGSDPLRYIDLFAGCGGLSEGFDRHGHYHAVAHVEWERAPLETLRNRMRASGDAQPKERALRFDIQKTRELLEGGRLSDEFDAGAGLLRLADRAGGVDLVIGGPPCQAYSVAGRVRDEHGMHLDYRNYLFESYLAVVYALQPKVVVFENVPGMLSAAPGGVPITDRVIDAFQSAGYTIHGDLRKCVVDLSRFGVPQRRKRVIIVGLRNSDFGTQALPLLTDFYNNLLPSEMSPTRTVFQAIGHLPRLMPASAIYWHGGRKYSHTPAESGVPDHSPRFHSVRDQQIFHELAEDVLSAQPKYQRVAALHDLYTERTGKSSAVHKYYVLRPEEPSNLIPAHLHKDGLRHIHYDAAQARSITVREAALLQGFPEDFAFHGSQSDKYKMIGNAVPPSFSARLARAVRNLLSRGATSYHHEPASHKAGKAKSVA